MPTPTLDELLIEGWRLGPYGPGLDPAIFNTFSAINAPDTSAPDLIGAFLAPPGGLPEVLAPPPAPPAPPRPAPLPEVLVTAGRSLAPTLGVITSIAAPFVPTPIAEEPDPRTLEPVFPQPLEEVTISARRPPAEPPPSLVASPATPSDDPNWLQPLGWQDYLRFGLESASRAAGNILRREFLGEVADAVRDAFRPDQSEPDSRPVDAERPADAPGDRGSNAAPVLDTVTVTARRPAPVVGLDTFTPGVLPDPLLGVEFDPFRLPDPDASPAPATRAQPVARPAPRVVTTTRPLVGTPTDIVTWLTPFAPLDLPNVAPPRAAPAPPRTPPRLAPDPIDIFDPILTLTPFTDPPSAPPGTKADTCNCPPPPKKRKRRPPRAICNRGTYVQSRKGISYTPKESFPCP